jgi:hypothetical protein
LGAPKPKFPLFVIDVEINENKEPEYSHDAMDVVDCILNMFDKGLQALDSIV